MTRKAQVLAPAGSMEAVVAAVRTGAHAVYLGTQNFNARRGAENFDFEALRRAVAYCHARGVKVHVTLNTLVSDAELPAAIETLRHVCATGADVLILQDLGLAALCRACAPDPPRHASTQMSVQTPAGVALLKELGYSRAVLPRELTKDEIAAVRKSTDLELEVFIHGAQCMCVSGQCYMSAMLGARSGNRGLCAQPCRLAFSAGEPGRHDLSLKDLSLIDRLQELCDLGVESFKIEGRMKRPEYVAAAVTAAKNALQGKDDPALTAALEAVFSRSGFTSGYYDDARGKEMFGIRRKEDVTAATGKVLSSLARLYDKETPRVPVEFYLTVHADEPPTLAAKAGGKTVFVSHETLPEPARTKPLMEEALRDRLAKCGGTPFFAAAVEIELDAGLALPAGVVNALRRNALEQLENALSTVKPVTFTDINFVPKKKITPDAAAFSALAAGTHVSPRSAGSLAADPFENAAPTGAKPTEGGENLPAFHVYVENDAQVPTDLSHVENLYLPLFFKENSVENVKNGVKLLGVTIPRGIFGESKKVENALRRAKEFGIETALCFTLDAVAIAQKMEMNVHTGFSMNIFNSESARVLETLGVKAIALSPELTRAQLLQIETHVPRGIFAYGRLPLMLTRNCPVRNVKRCGDCKRESDLTDRLGVRFPVRCDFGCAEVLNSRPIVLSDRAHEFAALDFLAFSFTTETREEADAVLRAYRTGAPAKEPFTRGLYYRGVE